MKEENRLYQKLRALIRKKNKEILEELKKLDRIPTSDVELKALLLPLTEAKEEYTNIVIENTQETIRAGMARTVTELKRQGWGKSVKSNMAFILNGSIKAGPIGNIDFNEFSQDISDRLRLQTFVASEQTMDRMTGNIMNNLKESYEAGYGIDKAADNLGNVFENMEGYELKRVARTEINDAQNRGAEATMIQLGIQYDLWRTAGDERVRGLEPEDTADHVYLDGQISKVGEPFSNGLTRPGDRTGPIGEWINCRCTLVPFLMPEGFIAPEMSFFYESDLIPVTIQPQPKPKEIETKPQPKPKERKITQPKPKLIQPETKIPKVSEPKYYAEDIADAEKYITEQLNMDLADYTGLKLEYANDINAKLVELKAMYPEINLKQIRAYDMGHPSTGGIMGSSTVYDKTLGTRTTLHINTKFFDKYPTSYDLKKKIMSGYKDRFTTSKNLEDLVTHEMGHSLTYAKSGQQSVSGVMDYRSVLQHQPGIKGISKYGEYNLSECIAESFVKYKRGDKLSEEIMEILQKYLGVN